MGFNLVFKGLNLHRHTYRTLRFWHFLKPVPLCLTQLCGSAACSLWWRQFNAHATFRLHTIRVYMLPQTHFSFTPPLWPSCDIPYSGWFWNLWNDGMYFFWKLSHDCNTLKYCVRFVSRLSRGPTLVGCPRLLIQYIRSYRPFWRPLLLPQPEEALRRGDSDQLIMGNTLSDSFTCTGF